LDKFIGYEIIFNVKHIQWTLKIIRELYI